MALKPIIPELPKPVLAAPPPEEKTTTELPPPPEPPEYYPGYQQQYKAQQALEQRSAKRLKEAVEKFEKTKQLGIKHPFSYQGNNPILRFFGFSAPKGYFLPATGGLMSEEEYQKQLAAAQIELDTTTQEYNRMSWRMNVLNAIPLLVADEQTPTRTIEDIFTQMTNAFMTDDDKQWATDIFDQLKYLQPTTLPEGYQGTTQEVKQKVLDAILAKPKLELKSVHNLTVDELAKSFMPITAEMPAGMTAADVRSIMSDLEMDEETQKQVTDIHAAAQELVKDWQTQAGYISLLRAGTLEAEAPNLTPWEFTKLILVQPAMATLEVLDKYYNMLPRPLAAAAILTFSRLTQDSDAGELEKLYNKYRDEGMGAWEAYSKAFNDWGGNIWLKMFIETAFDPTTYIGFGIATKIAKPIPYLGKFIGATERGWIEMCDIPFKGLRKAISKIPKTPTQRALSYAQQAFVDCRAYLRNFTGKDIEGLTVPEIREAFENAIKQATERPMETGDQAVRVGRYLTEYDFIEEPAVKEMLQVVGGEGAQVTQQVVHDVNYAFDAFYRKTYTAKEAAAQMLTVSGVDATEKNVAKMATLLDKEGAKVASAALDVIKGDNAREVLSSILKNVEDMQVRKSFSPVYEYALKSGRATAWVGRAVDTITRNSILAKIDRAIVAPMANQYLLFTNYGPFNVIESALRSFLGGGEIMYPRAASPVDELVRAGEGLTNLPYEMIMAQRELGRMEIAVIDPKTGKTQVFSKGKIPGVTKALPRGFTISIGGKDYPIRSWQNWNDMFGDIGTKQRAYYLLTKYKQFLAEMAPDQIDQIAKVFDDAQPILDSIKSFSKGEKNDFIRVLQQDATVGADMVRQHDIPLADLERRKALKDVNKLLDKCTDIYSPQKQAIRDKVLDGSIWKDVDASIEGIKQSVREFNIVSLQNEAVVLDKLVLDLKDFAPATTDELLKNISFLSDLVDGISERIGEVRSITQRRASKLVGEEIDNFHRAASETLAGFIGKSKDSIDTMLDSIMKNTSRPRTLLDDLTRDVTLVRTAQKVAGGIDADIMFEGRKVGSILSSKVGGVPGSKIKEKTLLVSVLSVTEKDLLDREFAKDIELTLHNLAGELDVERVVIAAKDEHKLMYSKAGYKQIGISGETGSYFAKDVMKPKPGIGQAVDLSSIDLKQMLAGKTSKMSQPYIDKLTDLFENLPQDVVPKVKRIIVTDSMITKFGYPGEGYSAQWVQSEGIMRLRKKFTDSDFYHEIAHASGIADETGAEKFAADAVSGKFRTPRMTADQTTRLQSLTDAIKLRHSNTLAARDLDRKIINDAVAVTPRSKRDKEWWDWLEQKRSKEAWEPYWSQEEELFNSVEDLKLGMMNSLGVDITTPNVVPQVVDKLAPAHVAYMMGVAGDDMYKALTKVGAMTTIRSKNRFTSWVYRRANKVAATLGKTAEDIGFDRVAIGDVYDQMFQSVGIDPAFANKEVLAPAMMQLDDVKQELIHQYGLKAIPAEDYTKFQAYINKVSDGIEGLKLEPESWTAIKDEAMMKARTQMNLDFTDYDDRNMVDAAMRMIYPFWCVPESTKILTRHGWKHYKELRIGEDVLTTNPKTLVTEWQPLQKIAEFDYDDKLMVIPAKGKDIAFTPNHRWLTITPNNLTPTIKRGYELTEGYDLIPRALPHQFPSDSLLTPREAAILGWACTDGYISRPKNRKPNLKIYQSVLKFQEEVESCTGKKMYPRTAEDLDNLVCYVSQEDSDKILEVCPDWSCLPNIVTQLSKDAAESMHRAMSMAEGNWDTSYNGKEFFRFKQNEGPVSETYQILSILTGKAITVSGSGLQTVTELNNNKPYQSKQCRRMTTKHYTGKVWCPVTANGTWFANFNGCVLPTGNTYEWQRWFWLPRTMLRTPGVGTAIGRYMNYTEDGYISIPGTDIQFNPLRGSVFMGGFRRLYTRDYPEYYDSFPGMNVIDFISRMGFYPGVQIMLPIVATGAATGKPEWSELLPAWARTVMNAARAVAPQQAGAVIDHVFPDRFKDYLTMLTLGELGYDADALWKKKAGGQKLTAEEQALWLKAANKATGLKGILFEQTGIFRLRPTEYAKYLEDQKLLIEEMTGVPVSVQKTIQDRYATTGKRFSDYYKLDALQQKILYNSDAAKRWQGITTPLNPSAWQQEDIRIRDYYESVTQLYTDYRKNGVYDEQGNLVAQSLKDITTQWVGGKIGPDQWRSSRGDLLNEASAAVRELGKRVYPDVPKTLDERAQRYAERGTPAPTYSPDQELMYMYYDIKPEMKYNWDNGTMEYDFDSYYAKVDALLSTLDGEFRQRFLDRIQYDWNGMEKLYWEVSREYLKPYRQIRNAVLEQYTPEQKTQIERFEVARGAERDELQELLDTHGQKLISGFNSKIRQARQRMRYLDYELDAWCYFFGITDTTMTTKAKETYNDYAKQYLTPAMVE